MSDQPAPDQTKARSRVDLPRIVRRRPSSRTFRITTAPERNGITAEEVKTSLVRRFPEWEWAVQELDEQGNLMTSDGRSIITPNTEGLASPAGADNPKL